MLSVLLNSSKLFSHQSIKQAMLQFDYISLSWSSINQDHSQINVRVHKLMSKKNIPTQYIPSTYQSYFFSFLSGECVSS